MKTSLFERLVSISLPLRTVQCKAIAGSGKATIAVSKVLPRLRIDRKNIELLFQHLIGNAVKFMDKEQAQIIIYVAEEEEAFTFRVSDNGPGIDPSYHEKVFCIFQKPSDPNHANEALGVGLATAKKIVELHGGRIWLESELGRGTSVFFSLPKQPVDEPTEGIPVPAGLTLSTA